MDGIDSVENGGGRGRPRAPAAAAGPLPKMLAFEGVTMASLAIGTLVRRPKNHSAHQLPPAAYYLADFVLFLFGVGLMVLSAAVAVNPDYRALAKAVMWGTLAPLLLLLALGELANPSIGF